MFIVIEFLCYHHQCQQTHYVFRLSVESVHPFIHLSVRLSGQILLPRYLMNSLSNLNETYRDQIRLDFGGQRSRS